MADLTGFAHLRFVSIIVNPVKAYIATALVIGDLQSDASALRYPRRLDRLHDIILQIAMPVAKNGAPQADKRLWIAQET